MGLKFVASDRQRDVTKNKAIRECPIFCMCKRLVWKFQRDLTEEFPPVCHAKLPDRVLWHLTSGCRWISSGDFGSNVSLENLQLRHFLKLLLFVVARLCTVLW